MKGHIYKIINTKTTDIYIGSTVQELKNRFKTHRSNAKLGKKEDLYECMRKNGIENFSIELLEEFEIISKSDLGLKEKEYYQKFKPTLNMRTPTISRDKKYGRVYKLFYIKEITQFYIGSTTKNIKTRLREHSHTSLSSTTPIYTFMREKGKENFEIECLEDEIPFEQLISRENHWIREMKPTLNKNTNLCITEKERDHLKYIKNREKRLQQVNERRLLKRNEINAQKMEHYYANKDKINGKDKEKRRELREKVIMPYEENPNFTNESLTKYTVFELKEIAKRLGLKKSPKLKSPLIEKILKQQLNIFK